MELLGSTASRRIDALVHDLVEASEVAGDIVQTPRLGEAMLAPARFMFESVYLRAENASERRRVAHVVDALFTWFCAHPEELPAGPDATTTWRRGSWTMSPA